MMFARLVAISLFLLTTSIVANAQQLCPNQTGMDHVKSVAHELWLMGQRQVSGYPKLIDITLEELEVGLESGQFTSVDLVNVGNL